MNRIFWIWLFALAFNSCYMMEGLTEEEEMKRKLLKVIEDDMVFVEGGSFVMGCTKDTLLCASHEKPKHIVKLNDFYISRYEFTLYDYKFLMENRIERTCPECPVVDVSWDDAQRCIDTLNAITGMHYRLLTEAEWEYAARGGKKSKGYTFAGGDSLALVAWYSMPRVQPVGNKLGNELDLYDMSGNVHEWCADYYDASYYASSPAENPTGPPQSTTLLRVIRGGSWSSALKNCRVSFRAGGNQSGVGSNIGFRIARNP